MISSEEIVIDTGYSEKVLKKEQLNIEDLIYIINSLKEEMKLKEEMVCASISELNKKNFNITVRDKSNGIAYHNFELQEYLEKQLKWVRRIRKQF